jgi:hypothetical protein
VARAALVPRPATGFVLESLPASSTLFCASLSGWSRSLSRSFSFLESTVLLRESLDDVALLLGAGTGCAAGAGLVLVVREPGTDWSASVAPALGPIAPRGQSSAEEWNWAQLQ